MNTGDVVHSQVGFTLKLLETCRLADQLCAGLSLVVIDLVFQTKCLFKSAIKLPNQVNKICKCIMHVYLRYTCISFFHWCRHVAIFLTIFTEKN